MLHVFGIFRVFFPMSELLLILSHISVSGFILIKERKQFK